MGLKIFIPYESMSAPDYTGGKRYLGITLGSYATLTEAYHVKYTTSQLDTLGTQGVMLCSDTYFNSSTEHAFSLWGSSDNITYTRLDLTQNYGAGICSSGSLNADDFIADGTVKCSLATTASTYLYNYYECYSNTYDGDKIFYCAVGKLYNFDYDKYNSATIQTDYDYEVAGSEVNTSELGDITWNGQLTTGTKQTVPFSLSYVSDGVKDEIIRLWALSKGLPCWFVDTTTGKFYFMRFSELTITESVAGAYNISFNLIQAE